VTNFLAGTVSVIETATNQVSATIEIGGSPALVSFSSTGAQAYVVNAGENTVVMINSATDNLAGSPIPMGKQPLNLAASPDFLPAFSRFVAVGFSAPRISSTNLN
jgi:YVTN family beta-propeller protein